MKTRRKGVILITVPRAFDEGQAKQADWTRAILFALCALTWLPDWPVERANWLRVVFPIVCAAIAVWNLIRYFKDRKAENEEK